MRGIRIISPGVHSTLQDNGRYGYRAFGLPVSGVMDIESYQLANWLVSNQPGDPVIEASFHGLAVEFLSAAVIALTGADASAHINGKMIENWRTIKVRRGDTLELSGPSKGVRTYLAIGGAFRIDEVLGSYSTYLQGGTGGYRGRELRKGDIIPLYPGIPFITRTRIVPSSIIPLHSESTILRVLPGIDFTRFSNEAISKLTGSTFTVSPRSDRMGIRLSGEYIDTSAVPEIISYPAHPGVVQVPPGGEPIILGSDSQTTGGYPQPLVVISGDLSLAGRLKPGSSLSFELIERDEALMILREREAAMSELTGITYARVCTDCMAMKR